MGGRVIAGVALLSTVAAVAACQRGENGTAGGPYAKEVARAIPKLERAAGLKFKTPPKLELRTRDAVRSFIEARFNEDLPAEELSGMERVYKRFGLLPDTLDLRRFMLELLSEQVIGYYDPRAKVLYVVEGADEATAELTISHELVHALQDQYFNLDSLQGARDDNDRATAAQAVIEGQATLEQIGAMLGSNNFATALPGGWDRVRQMIRESQNSMPVFAAAPTLLQETLIFPYLSGAEYMRRFKEAYPGQAPFAQMPTSTEQILHPQEAFFGKTRDHPTVVTLPAPKLGTVAYQNNLGEFETRLLLFEYLRDLGSAVRGAAGWDGDRYQLIDTGRGEALAWVTLWDNAIDAGEFFNLLDAGVVQHRVGVTPRTSTQFVREYGAGGRTISVSVGDVGGRPVVLLTDVPSGVAPALIDISKVALKE